MFARILIIAAASSLLAFPALAQQCAGSYTEADGYEGAGTETRSLDANGRGASIVVSSSVSSGSFAVCAYVEDSATGDGFQAAVGLDADRFTVVAESAVRTDISTAGWYLFTGGDFTTYAPTATTAIWVLIGSDSAASANIYDDQPGSGGNGAVADNGISIDPFVVTTGFDGVIDDASRNYRIHIQYNTGGGGTTVPLFTRRLLFP